MEQAIGAMRELTATADASVVPELVRVARPRQVALQRSDELLGVGLVSPDAVR
jgi:hypothetical protein